MHKVIFEEIHNSVKTGTFRVTIRHEHPDGANTLTVQFVLPIKSKADGSTRYKVIYVISGHLDSLKQYLVHSEQSLKPMPARLILVLVSTLNFRVWFLRDKLVCFQSTEPLLRIKFIKDKTSEI